MSIENSFHARDGVEFLGLRVSRRGRVEVVYDSGRDHRYVWRVLHQGAALDEASLAQERQLSEALRLAAQAPRVLPALHDELKKRALTLESAQN